jgi:hypothetical protein
LKRDGAGDIFVFYRNTDLFVSRLLIHLLIIIRTAHPELGHGRRDDFQVDGQVADLSGAVRTVPAFKVSRFYTDDNQQEMSALLGTDQTRGY